MSPWVWSLIIWAGIWGGLFLAFELPAATGWPKEPPWNTLSWTVWQIAARHAVFAMAIAGGMFVLLLHFVLPGHWPRKSTRARINEREGRR